MSSDTKRFVQRNPCMYWRLFFCGQGQGAAATVVSASTPNTVQKLQNRHLDAVPSFSDIPKPKSCLVSQPTPPCMLGASGAALRMQPKNNFGGMLHRVVLNARPAKARATSCSERACCEQPSLGEEWKKIFLLE